MTENDVQYGTGAPLSAKRLMGAMATATQRKYDAGTALIDATALVDARTESLALIEAMTVDAWVGAMTEADRKTAYGTNDADRKRNSTTMLAGNAAVAAERHALVEAEYAAALARLDLERSADHVQNLRSIAWAWGSECNRGYEPVEDRMARRDQALPASMMAERAGIKLTRDVD